MVGLISLRIEVVCLVAYEELQLLRAQLGCSNWVGSLVPVEVLDKVLGIVGSNRLGTLYKVAKFLGDELLLKFVGTCDILFEDSLEAVKPLGRLRGVARIVGSSERVEKHLLAYSLYKIGAHMVDYWHILQTIALGDVATPNRLIDSIRVDTLNNIAEVSLEDAGIYFYVGILVLGLRIIANLGVCRHLADSFTIAYARAHITVLGKGRHGKERH